MGEQQGSKRRLVRLEPLFLDSIKEVRLLLSVFPHSIPFVLILHSHQVKKINQAALPLSYSQSFYKGLLDPQLSDFCKVATLDNRTVGALCAALEHCKKGDKKDDDARAVVWIMTLAVLANFRCSGVGSQLMDSLLDACKANGIAKIMLHVQTSNEDAIRFYTKRFGFVQGERLHNYYPRLDPPDCFLLKKTIDNVVPLQPNASVSADNARTRSNADASTACSNKRSKVGDYHATHEDVTNKLSP